MKKLLLLLEHKIIKIGLIIVIVLVGFFLFYEQEIKEKAVNVSQGKFPTSSYLFQAYEGIKNKIDTINEVKPNDETKSVNENIEKTQKDLDDFNALVQKLPNLPKDFNKTLIKPQSPSSNYNTANEDEKTRLVILASRISSQKETQPPISIKNSVSNTKSKEKQELEKEYGSSGFKNFKRKNIASSENKLLRTITADRMIPAILITPISSEIGGSKIVAQVESDIYATMGRAVLIPENPKNYDGSVNHLEKDDQGNIIMKEGMLDPIIRNEANKWAKANDKEFASIKSVYSRFMQVFTSYQVKSATDSMSFEYEDLRTDNISLYIKIAQTDIDTLAPLIRILLESIAKNLLLKESKKFEERVYLFLDEFVRFGKLPFLLEMPALSRSYGVVLIFITQSNALIEKYYGKEDARIVNSTVAYKVIFKMDDLEYTKQVSEEIGKMTRKTRSHSTEKGQLITEGTFSIGKEAWDLLSAQDIMNIDKDEVIILVSGHKAKPLKLKANYYFKNKELLSRINWEVKPNEEVF